jgi:RelA/SpoT family (p)ppGpp synthetase
MNNSEGFLLEYDPGVSVSLDILIQKTLNYSPVSDPELLRSAYAFCLERLGDRELTPGVRYFDHALGTAMVLTRLQVGSEALAAALLHDVPLLTAVTADELNARFGDEIGRLLAGLVRMNRLSWDKLEGDKAVGLRQLILAMVDDVRVVLIRLAEQLNTMYSLSAFPLEDRRMRSRESLHVFAPLADRLGIGSFKGELEDLALQRLEPGMFQKISGLLAQRRDTREHSIGKIVEALQEELAGAGIPAEVKGRPKHLFSIYQKMKSTQREFDEIYDVQAVRLIVPEIKDCYAALDLVHGMWSPIPGQYDDYISVPKPNLYQSLHTAVSGPAEHALEIQIRTTAMHRTAELGVAAHWRYKESAGQDISLDAKVAYLRGLMAWQHDLVEGVRPQGDKAVGSASARDVFVLTPQGDVFALPQGATPLDFAYRIHSGVGHRCRGSKINGKMIPLETPLQNGDRVEILTRKNEAPSRDWLNPRRGFVRTRRARRDIRMWFLRQEHEEYVSRGRDQVARVLKRLGERVRDYEQLAARFGYSGSEGFLEAVGRGQIRSEHLKNRLIQSREGDVPAQDQETAPEQEVSAGVSVRGMDGLLTRVARCCRPLPGDPVVGYITRGRGITVHRQDCFNLQRLSEKDRLVEIQWEQNRQGYSVPVRIVGSASPKLLKEVAKIVEDQQAKLLGTSVRISRTDRLQTLLAKLEIRDAAQLQKILQRIKGLPDVTEARRTH